MSKRQDKTGLKYGRLKVLALVKSSVNKKGLKWKCLCDCGTKKVVYGENLSRGKTLSCGCYKSEQRKKRLGKSRKIGLKIGRLTVISTFQKPNKSGRLNTMYNCRCDCGKNIITRLTGARSCGCWQIECLIERSKKQLGWASKTNIWNYYKRNAKTRNLPWELEKPHFLGLITKPCYYCKVPPWNIVKTQEGDWTIISGVDRKNNKLGYTVENSVPCCKICNRAKLDLDLETFENWINALKNS